MTATDGSPWPGATHKKHTVGAAGEHYVLAALLRRGFIAAQAPPGLKDIDIVVHHPVTHQSCELQVKSKRTGSKWTLSKKHERIQHGLVFAFVDFVPSCPDVYVLPSFDVARAIRLDNWCYKKATGKSNPMRFLQDPMAYPVPGTGEGWLQPYRNNWEPVNTLTTR